MTFEALDVLVLACRAEILVPAGMRTGMKNSHGPG
jgi:hypothetical protein